MKRNEAIKMTLQSPEFLDAWEEMLSTKQLEINSLKTICAMFYFVGFWSGALNEDIE